MLCVTIAQNDKMLCTVSASLKSECVRSVTASGNKCLSPLCTNDDRSTPGPDKNRDTFLFLFCASKKEKEKKIRIPEWVSNTPLSLTLWDSSVAACDKNDCTENGRSFWMTRLCRMLGSYYKPPFNYIKSWNFSNNYCNVRDLSKHQGTKALHHFAPKLIEALPGNGLFIPAPLYSGDCRVHFFVSFLCKQKRKETMINENKQSGLPSAIISSLRFFSRGII